MSKAITPVTNHHVDHLRQTHWVWHAIPQPKNSHFAIKQICIARNTEPEYYRPDVGTVHLNEEAAKKLREDLTKYLDQCNEMRFENVKQNEQKRWHPERDGLGVFSEPPGQEPQPLQALGDGRVYDPNKSYIRWRQPEDPATSVQPSARSEPGNPSNPGSVGMPEQGGTPGT